MAFPMPTALGSTSLNPIEGTILSLNSNPYFIGSMMLLLNLGGRHFATALTPEQDKFFQQVWFRRALVFIVFFIGTRNILSSLWMSIVYIIIIGYLFNDQSSFFLFKPTTSIDKEKEKEKEKEKPLNPVQNYTGLTAEEADIHKKLSDKLERSKSDDKDKNKDKDNLKGYDITSDITSAYSTIMSRF